MKKYQFISLTDSSMTKELLSALVAMDELMGSNEMNMQVAAMTPAVIFFMAVRRTFSWLFYSVVKEGKSKDDVYGTEQDAYFSSLHGVHALHLFYLIMLHPTSNSSNSTPNHIGY